MSGGFKPPGPLCQVLNWYAEEPDPGTTSLTVHRGPADEPEASELPGPQASLGGHKAQFAGRPTERDPLSVDQLNSDRAMIEGALQLFASFPFARTARGREIVQELRSLLKTGNIVFGEPAEDARGDWDGTTLRINQRFRGRLVPTILELVHEASHAVWRHHHPVKQDAQARRLDNIEDEFLAVKTQLAVYAYIKSLHPDWPTDMDMEFRSSTDDRTLHDRIESQFAPVTDSPPASPPVKQAPAKPREKKLRVEPPR